MQSIKRGLVEKDKTTSRRYVDEFKRNFLDKEPIPGIEFESKIYDKYIPFISLNEVNAHSENFVSKENRVVLVSYPEKPGIHVPDETELSEILNRAQDGELEPYEDEITDEALFSKELSMGKISEEKYFETLGVSKLKCSNGVTIYLRPSDFKNNQILVSAYSPGGWSPVSDENLETAKISSAIISNNGLGNFDRTSLRKKLAGKSVGVNPYISKNSEGFSGSSTVSDIETLFQMIHLNFTDPRLDENAFTVLKNQIAINLKNRQSNPNTAFEDSLSAILTNHHPRRQLFTMEMLDQINDTAALAFYKDRFADASDFTLFFAGNFTVEGLKPLIKKYIATLPTIQRTDKWENEHISAPKGKITKNIYKGMEDKGKTRIILHGELNWTLENVHNIQSMTQVMNILLREKIREDLGGTYGVGVWTSLTHYPESKYKINIAFDSDPERTGELTEAILKEIENLKTTLVDESYIQKVNRGNIEDRKLKSKTNGFWIDKLNSYTLHNFGIENILNYDQLVANFTAEVLKENAKIYLNMELNDGQRIYHQ